MSNKPFKIELLPHQWQFINSPEKVVALIGGLGSGKSYALLAFILQMISEQPDTNGLVCANTHAQLRDVLLLPLFSMLDSLGINYDYNGQTGWLSVNDSVQIKCASLENYNTLRGIEVGWLAIEELRDCREEAFLVALGRVRCPKASRHLVRVSTTPNGYDWIYDRFAGELKTVDYTYINAKSKDNPYLPDGYIESLTASYDSRLLQQEVEGLFIGSTQGAVYHSFSKANIKEFEAEDFGYLPLKVGMDFNVNPCTSCIGWFTDNAVYIRHEVWLEDSNTSAMGKQLLTLFGSHLTIYPDASGKARKTSSAVGDTDHEILRRYGFQVEALRANPAVKDRYNVVNWLFEQKKLFIHPDCKKLIKDLNHLTHNNTNKSLSHMSDALGYLTWSFKPLQKPRKPSRTLIPT